MNSLSGRVEWPMVKINGFDLELSWPRVSQHIRDKLHPFVDHCNRSIQSSSTEHIKIEEDFLVHGDFGVLRAALPMSLTFWRRGR